MALEIGGVDYGGIVSNTLGTMGAVTKIVVYAGIALVIVMLILYYAGFKIHFRVKKLTGDKKIIIDTKAKRIINKDGSSWLKLRGFRNTAPEPPPECIQIGAKGQEYIEGYYNTGTREFIYILDDNNVNDRKLQELVRATKDMTPDQRADAYRKAKIVSTLQPFTSNDREFVVNNIYRAIARKKMKWTEHLPLIISGTILIVALAVLLIFWKDAVTPMHQMTGTYQAITKDQKEITTMLKEIIHKQQIITDNSTTPLPDRPPS